MNKPELTASDGRCPNKADLAMYEESLAKYNNYVSRQERAKKDLEEKMLEEKGITFKSWIEKKMEHYGECWDDVLWVTLSQKQLEEKLLPWDAPPYPFYMWTHESVYGLDYEEDLIALPRKMRADVKEQD